MFPSFGETGTGQTYFFDDALFLDAVPEFVIPTVNVALGMNGFNFTVDGEVGGKLFLEPGYQYVLDTSTLVMELISSSPRHRTEPTTVAGIH